MSDTTLQPSLVLIVGPPGFGKSTLAHALAAVVGCPMVSRDEIKEGMVHASPGSFTAAPGDPLTKRTFPTFFAVINLLLEAGSSVIAEAAFGGDQWRHGLTLLSAISKRRVRVIQCRMDPEVAYQRAVERFQSVATRRAHTPPRIREDFLERCRSFSWMDGPEPTITVDTTGPYSPSLEKMASFTGPAR